MAAMSQQSQDLVDQLNAVPEDEQEAVAVAVRSAMKDWIPPTDESRRKIWLVLIIGAFLLAAGCLVGAVFLSSRDKDATALFAAVTGIVGLVIGLFSEPPKGST